MAEITIYSNKKEEKVEINIEELILKAQQRSLTPDEIQKILNYLLTKK